MRKNSQSDSIGFWCQRALWEIVSSFTFELKLEVYSTTFQFYLELMAGRAKSYTSSELQSAMVVRRGFSKYGREGL